MWNGPAQASSSAARAGRLVCEEHRHRCPKRSATRGCIGQTYFANVDQVDAGSLPASDTDHAERDAFGNRWRCCVLGMRTLSPSEDSERHQCCQRNERQRAYQSAFRFHTKFSFSFICESGRPPGIGERVVGSNCRFSTLRPASIYPHPLMRDWRWETAGGRENKFNLCGRFESHQRKLVGFGRRKLVVGWA